MREPAQRAVESEEGSVEETDKKESVEPEADSVDETEEDKDSDESESEVARDKEICGSQPHNDKGFFVRTP